jgi:hypothetical protein
VNALRPYPGYANIRVQENEDRSNYNSVQVSAVRKMHRGLEFGINYTFSRTLDTSSDTPQDAYNVAADYGLSAIHRAHVLTLSYVYELPFFRQHPSRFLRGVLGGWDLSGVTVYQSGAPFTVTVPVDVARIGVTSSRATLVDDPTLPGSERTPERWFNTEAFLAPERMTPGQFGTSGRNILIGPSFRQWDVALSKWVGLGPRVKLQLRAEAFNVFNQVSFTGLNTTVRFDSSGRPAQGYGAVTAAGPGRTLEFGARVTF